MELGDIIRSTRVRRGWTQARLGKYVGCTGPNIAHIEKGKVPAKLLLEKICQRLELNFGELWRLAEKAKIKERIEKVDDADLKRRLYEALDEDTPKANRERRYYIDSYIVAEGTIECGQIKALLGHPERFMVIEDDREGRLLEEFRQFDDRRKDLALEIITSLPKRSKIPL